VESLFGGAEGSGELEGGGAGAGPGSAAAATTGASGGGGGTRFGPVFSVPGNGDDRLAGDGIDDDEDDDDEDGVVMVREIGFFLASLHFSSLSGAPRSSRLNAKQNKIKPNQKISALCPLRRQRTTSTPSPSCCPRERTRCPGT